MSYDLDKLTWLLESPKDFLKKLENSQTIDDLKILSSYALDENQLFNLAKKIQILKNIKDHKLTQINLGILSDTTTQLVTPAIIATALRHGILLNVIQSEYNQIEKDSFSEDSIFKDKKLDFLFLSFDYRNLKKNLKLGNKKDFQVYFDNYLNYIHSIINSLKKITNAKIILQNIVHPCDNFLGSFENRLSGSLLFLISKVNEEFNKFNIDNVYIFDCSSLANNVGLFNWHDPVIWNIAKIPFSPKYIPIYSEHFIRILISGIGKSRRCLIVDLDNTLWGGIIGDDGPNGINISNGDPTGEAYLEIQKTILELKKRGIILAVCSKNEDLLARKPFKENLDMIIKESDISVFQANWFDKATNIRSIAKELSLGLDAFVFLDDNPAERMLVRRELPEVAVPELPLDPAFFSRTLILAGYFESLSFSEEDQKRTELYKNNALRSEIKKQSSDINAYLKSLEMEAIFSFFNEEGRTRVVQLINKSNQFNLTTKRYSELEIKRIQEDDTFIARYIRLKDVIGDNGIISVVICKKSNAILEIDTWLMSCRVLGRRLEELVLQEIILNAKKLNINKIVGNYIATERNIIVKDHYKKLGFKKIFSSKNSDKWELKVADYSIKDIPIKIQYSF